MEAFDPRFLTHPTTVPEPAGRRLAEPAPTHNAEVEGCLFSQIVTTVTARSASRAQTTAVWRYLSKHRQADREVAKGSVGWLFPREAGGGSGAASFRQCPSAAAPNPRPSGQRSRFRPPVPLRSIKSREIGRNCRQVRGQRPGCSPALRDQATRGTCRR